MIRWFERHNKFSLIIAIYISIVIFYFSMLTSFGPQITPKTNILSIIYHVSIFFFLSLFLLISIVKGKNFIFIIPTIAISILYGILDEVHQSFVPGRVSGFSDVLLDVSGIALAAIVYIVYNKVNKNL